MKLYFHLCHAKEYVASQNVCHVWYFSAAETLCETYEEDVVSQYGTTSFSVSVIDGNKGYLRSGDAALSGSGSSMLINNDEYLYINDFRREDGSFGSVDLVSLSFSVNSPTTAVCYFINSADESLVEDGV